MEPEKTKDDEGRMLLIGVAVLFGFELVIIVSIMIAAGASLRDTILVLLLVIGTSAAALFAVTRLLWVPFQLRYPQRPILEGAVSRSLQSFSLGKLARFNNAVRISVDEEHLHIGPLFLLVPFGARRISIPWDRITDVRPGFWPGCLKATLDGRTIAGPAWCLELALDPVPSYQSEPLEANSPKPGRS